MKYMQKLGKALMLPVACLPICGILMGIGYLLCPATMQGGEMSGFWQMAGFFLVKAGSALIDNMAILFVIGVGAGMSEKNDGTGAVAALASWLMITTLLGTGTVSTLIPKYAEDAQKMLAFSKIANPFIGILSGIVGAECFNRFKNTKLPNWISFFSGKRCVVIIAGVFSLVLSFVLLFVWPLVFGALIAFGEAIAGLGSLGAGLYAFFNRLLIPTGLHHALNNVFWFDTIGLGDLSHFWAGETSADVSWSLGMYMSGFFPCMMFGIPGAALAIIRCAKPEKRKAAMGIMLSAAICSFVCGVTEPFEFSFMFLAPGLYVVYALLYGIFTVVVSVIGFRAGFCFSGGATDLLFSASLPAAQKTWLIIPLGIAAFVIFYMTFRLVITKWNLKTPGREDLDEETGSTGLAQSGGMTGAAKTAGSAGDETHASGATGAAGEYTVMAAAILEALGGRENLRTIDNCVTRLRLEVADQSLIDEKAIKAAGVRGIIKPGRNSVQLVIGTTVQFVADELERLYEAAGATMAKAQKTCENVGPSCKINPSGGHRTVVHGEKISVCGAGDGESTAGADAGAARGGMLAGGMQAGGDSDRASLCFEVKNPVGLHARPAGEIAKLAGRYKCSIDVECNGQTVSAKSIVKMMSLHAVQGSTLRFTAEGEGAEAAMAEISEYLRDRI